MTRLIIEISKYVLIALIVLYTLQCYLAFVKKDEDSREFLFLRQNVVMFCIHFVAFMVFYLKMERPMLLYFYGAQVLYLLATLVFFRNLYPRASKLIINNMCMLITIGFIMLTRLSYDQSTKQFTILAVGTVIALIIPVIIRKMRILTKWAWVYAVLGIGLLGVVAVIARSTYGAKLSLSVGGITLQPSEFVKILFVFFAAGMLAKSIEFKNIVVTTALAAFHVLILVISTDLGSALIFFITYLMMLYVATKDIRYLLAGFAAGALAAVAAYFLFSHVRVRVEIWQDPFKEYEGGGYQVAQALFAIGAGGWFGTGLFQGSPGAIPIVDVCGNRRRAWGNICHLPDSNLYELFYHVCKYFDETGGGFLPVCGVWSWMPLWSPGVFNCRRSDENDSDDRCYPASDQYRRQFTFKHPCIFFHYPGTLYFKRRRGKQV